MNSLIRSSRSLLVVAGALALPVFGACGGIVVDDHSDHPVNADRQVGVPDAPTSATSTTTTATSTTSAHPPASAYPCTSDTAAYYADPAPPPASGGCRDLYSPEKRHATGTVITIVAPTGASCIEVQCTCESSGHWGPASEPGCSW
jgi:hypothetical protein